MNSSMAKYKIILIIFLLGQTVLSAQTFDVSIDTMFIDIAKIARPASFVELTHAVKYHDKYYCFFQETALYSYNQKTRYFIIFSDSGMMLSNPSLPQKIIDTRYFDFFIRNDSLLVKEYSDQKSFYFDCENTEWHAIQEVDDTVYEDSSFAITYLDFGEWGQLTWFIDKQTEKEYVLGFDGTTVNRLNGKYFLTSVAEILMVEDPIQLEPCGEIDRYEEAEKRKEVVEYPTPRTGSKTIYFDSTCASLGIYWLEQRLITSFVAGNQLFQLYSDSLATFIGRIENQKLIPVQYLPRRYGIYNRNHSYRGKNLSNNGRFLVFGEDNNTFGFLEIDKFKIHIKYLIHNQDSLMYIGHDGFDQLMDMVLENSHDFSMAQVDSLEDRINGTDMKDNKSGISHNSFYPKKYKKQNVRTRKFVKAENKHLAQVIEYLYTEQDERVKSIFIKWLPAVEYAVSINFDYYKNRETMIKEQFVLKMKYIEQVISDRLNLEPQKVERGGGYIKLTWTLNNNIVIGLYGQKTFEKSHQIRLIMNLDQ